MIFLGFEGDLVKANWVAQGSEQVFPFSELTGYATGPGQWATVPNACAPGSAGGDESGGEANNGDGSDGGDLFQGEEAIPISPGNASFQFTHFYLNGEAKLEDIINGPWTPFADNQLDLNVLPPPPNKEYIWVKVKVNGVPTFAQLKFRGGYTLINADFGKKSFTLKFDKDYPRPAINGDKKKRLIFNANANDNSFIRNIFAMRLAKSIGAKAPDIYFPTSITLRRRSTPYIQNPGLSKGYYTIIRHTKSIEEIEGAVTGEGARIYSPQADIWDTWADTNPGHFFEAGKPDGVKSDNGTPEEAADLLRRHCGGEEIFDPNDYFLWMAMGYLLLDTDTHTKNFYFYLKNNGKYVIFHWDRDAILGYAPDGNENNFGILDLNNSFSRPGVSQDVTCMQSRLGQYNDKLANLRSTLSQSSVLAIFDKARSMINTQAADQDLATGYWHKQVNVDGKPARFIQSAQMMEEARNRLIRRMQVFGLQ